MKYMTLHGMRFCRDEKSGYYRNSTHQKLAHRHAWETEKGPIPEGWHVHHIDRDRGNNSIDNLLCLSEADHVALHVAEDQTFERRQQQAIWFASIQPKAKDWHSSPAGREWHRGHALATGFGKTERNCTCERCGSSYKTLKLSLARYCGNACRAAARRDSGVDDVERTCTSCKAAFIVNRYSSKACCSKSCANRHRNSVGAMVKGARRALASKPTFVANIPSIARR